MRAQLYQLRGDRHRMLIYADSARLAFEQQTRAAPEDGQRHALLGLALAYLGRKAEAMREGQRGLALMPISRDGYFGPYVQLQLARIYLLVGEPDRRWTSSSRCSGSRTISPPAGSGSTRPSTRCERTRGSSGW